MVLTNSACEAMRIKKILTGTIGMCVQTVLRNNQAQLLEELVALKMQQQTDKENVSVTQLRRKLQEKLGKARQTEQNTIKEELQRVTSIASNKRRELLKEDCSYAA